MSCINIYSKKKECGITVKTILKSSCISVRVCTPKDECFTDKEQFVSKIYFDNSGSMTTDEVESDKAGYLKFKCIGDVDIYLYISDSIECELAVNGDLCPVLKNKVDFTDEALGFVFDTGDRDNECRPLNMFDVTTNSAGTYILDIAPFTFTKIS